MTQQGIRLTGIEKAFGRNTVLCGVDMVLRPGEVTVLMGANGAGKSTLVKILCGVHRRDAGEILLDGAPYAAATPAEALAAGVVTVHQSIDDGVVGDLDVAANLMLDRIATPGSGFFYRRGKIRAAAADLARSIGLDVDLRQPVSALSLADRQMVAIARAMAHDPRLLILDEPTSSLSATEAERLFDFVARLRASGVSILYISHRMSDIRRVADRIVCLRDGAISGLFETAPPDYEAAVRAMLGHGLTDADHDPVEPGDAVIALDDLVLRPGAAPISTAFREGEITAVVGLVGSGKTRLSEVLFGVRPPTGGTMRLGGQAYAPGAPRVAIEAGVFLCPKDRATNAVVPGFSIARNVSLPFTRRLSALSFLSRRGEAVAAGRVIDTLGVVCEGPAADINTLSGGNQQKVAVGRWMDQPCRLLLLDEPFQGVDIRSRRDIGARLRATARGRATVIFVTELDEALELADRIVVMADHALRADHPARGIDIAALMAEVSGARAA